MPVAVLLLIVSAAVGYALFDTLVLDAVRPPGRERERPIRGPMRRMRLVRPVPEACLGPVSAPAAAAVAVHSRGRIRVTGLDGAERAAVPGRQPIAFSAGGGFIAAGASGRLWTAAGERAGRRDLGAARGNWAWSPAADCALAVGRGGRLAAVAPDGPSRTIVRRGVEEVAIAPDGRRAVVVIADSRRYRSIWIADLEAGRLREVRRFRGGCCVRLAGWGPTPLGALYWPAPRAARSGPVRLRSVTAPPVRHRSLLRTLADPDLVEPCGDRIVAVAGGGPARTGSMRIALVGRGKPVHITAAGLAYLDPSCDPRSQFAVATRRFATSPGRTHGRARLVLIELGSGDVSEIETDPSFDDRRPQWGRAGAGVVYERRPAGGPSQVWFIPEGGVPRFTGVVFDGRRGSFAWSGRAPTGLAPVPVRSP